MKKIILILFIFTTAAYTQQLRVNIEADKTEINNSSFSSNMDDHVKIKYVLYNNSDETVKVKFEPYFDINYTPEEDSYYNRCFRLFPVDSSGGFDRYMYDSYNSFVTLQPGDSAVREGFFTVSWPCRGAPPSGDWNLDVKFHSSLNDEMNFYLVNSRYTDSQSKEYVKAWSGLLESNTIKLKVIR